MKLRRRLTLRLPGSEAERAACRTFAALPKAQQTPTMLNELLQRLGVPEDRRRQVVLGWVDRKVYGEGAYGRRRSGARRDEWGL